MTSLGSHYCETCNMYEGVDKSLGGDFEKLCLPCALEHKVAHPDH